MTSGHRPPWPVTTLTIRIILTKLTNLTTLTILTNQKNYQEDKCRFCIVYFVLWWIRILGSLQRFLDLRKKIFFWSLISFFCYRTFFPKTATGVSLSDLVFRFDIQLATQTQTFTRIEYQHSILIWGYEINHERFLCTGLWTQTVGEASDSWNWWWRWKLWDQQSETSL